jgi:hypothetical protein
MTDSIDDVMPDPSDAPYVSILQCTECGATGRLYSTAEPRPEQYRDCPECEWLLDEYMGVAVEDVRRARE